MTEPTLEGREPPSLSSCGAVQTKAHDVVGTTGLQPTQDDKDAGLVGISPGFQFKDYRVISAPAAGGSGYRVMDRRTLIVTVGQVT